MRLWPRRQGSSLDLLVVGLGNPGREYAGNRHNVGYMVVDELARRHDGSWRSKFSGQLAEIRLDGHKLALLKPETFMNESGQSVGEAMRFFKLDPDAVLVVHDEGDLERGRLAAPARRRARRSQRPALDRVAPEDAGLPPAPRRRRPARSRRPASACGLRPRRLRAARRRRLARLERGAGGREARGRGHRARPGRRQPPLSRVSGGRCASGAAPSTSTRPSVAAVAAACRSLQATAPMRPRDRARRSARARSFA